MCHEYDHDHDHDHVHPHDHEHTHSHDHHSPEEALALLTYMLGHNRHHAEELHELAHDVDGEAQQLLHAGGGPPHPEGGITMCLSTVYNTAQQVLCKNVASVTEKDGQLIFTDIMGVPTAVTGSIQKIDLMDNIIVIRQSGQ